MGPYCSYCNNRCFTHLTDKMPEDLVKKYEPRITIIATCAAGQRAEKEKLGTCYDEIRERMKATA